jgi:hypothetical protein
MPPNQGAIGPMMRSGNAACVRNCASDLESGAVAICVVTQIVRIANMIR